MRFNPNQEISEADREIIMEDTYEDPVEFCNFFFPEVFTIKIPWLHRGILALLTGKCQFLLKYGEVDKIIENFVILKEPMKEDSEVIDHIFYWGEDGQLKMKPARFTLLMIPRGFSKTTIAGIVVPIYKIVFQCVDFFLYVSHAFPHSKMQLDNVKRELGSNEAIRAIFGELKPMLRDDETWSKDLFETNTGCAMAARGKGGQVRGLNLKTKRPKEIIVDDLEDAKSVKSDTQRHDTIHWAYADLMPALPKLDPDARIIALGTLLHKHDVLATFAGDSDRWTVVKFGAIDRQGDLLWPPMMDHEKIEQERASYARAGELHTFYMEYFSKFHSAETQVFQVDRILVSDVEGETLRHAVYLDPAFSEKRTADFACVSVVCMSEKGTLWVRECWMKRGASNSDMLNTFFAFQKQYNCEVAGIESVAGQAALVNQCREEMFRRHQYFELTPVPNKSRKVERVAGALQNRYNSNYLRHEKVFPELLVQLDDFRMDESHEHDDGPDGVAGAVILLDPFAAMAAGEDLSKDVYEPLKTVFGGRNWRRY